MEWRVSGDLISHHLADVTPEAAARQAFALLDKHYSHAGGHPQRWQGVGCLAA